MAAKVRFFNTVLGQKSLYTLHRADSSMMWNSQIFDKKHKWLSYNIWFLYIQFYKIIFFFNPKFQKDHACLNSRYKKSFFIYLKKHCNYPKKNSKRFCYYIDLYCFEFLGQIILINLYYVASLKFYKKKKTSNLKAKLDIFKIENPIYYTPHQISPYEIKTRKKFIYSEFF